MKVLVACEYSGIVRDAFIRKGHDAISCDLLPSESDFGPHYQGDVFDIINENRRPVGNNNFDLMIAHPPCTYLCNSGVQWLHRDRPRQPARERWSSMKDAALFFKRLLHSGIWRIAIENPIMHKHAVEIIGRRQDQVVKPCMFGDPVKKQTCLWLKGLPKLVATNTVEPERYVSGTGMEHDKWWFETSLISDLAERAKVRSKTFPGIADAMADQWG